MKRPMMVLYVAADEDEPLRKKLETHLGLLELQGKIQGWYAQQVLAGSVKAQSREQALKEASLVLLLVSANLLLHLSVRNRCKKR